MKQTGKTLLAIFLAGLLWVNLGTASLASLKYGEDYQLEQVLMLSRHNIRTPLVTGDSEAAKLTPHQWMAWSVDLGDLSLRGGQLEICTGQYFKDWLEAEELLPRHYLPEEGDLRFYANSYQRTIATARSFASGMVPLADVVVEHHYAINEKDPVFLPAVPALSAACRQRLQAEEAAMGGFDSYGSSLQKDADILARVLDFPDSKAAQESGLSSFRTDDLVLDVTDKLNLTGTLPNLRSAADALLMQYYETGDSHQAAFGKELSRSEWQSIARVGYYFINAHSYLPSYDTVMAHPLLTVMLEELNNEPRKFTFLGGHDVNLAQVLPALGVEDYDLPLSIEPKTPIGSKLVIGKWLGADGTEYADLHLVYLTADQLIGREPVSPANPPQWRRLELKGLTPNEDGLYLCSEVEHRLRDAIDAYDELVN